MKDGVRVVSLDPLSTGRSDDLRGVRGLITCIEDHIDDLKAAVDELEKSLPAKAPLFVLGESSGGLSACSMCLCDGVSERISKWILCAPALQVAPELLPPKFVQNIVRKIGMRFPAMSFPGEAISGETWDAAFGDDVSAELGRKDEYVLYKTPLRMGTAVSSLDAMDRVESALENGTMKMKDVLVLHNRVDCRTLYGGSKQFVERVVGRAELEDPGGCAHQLFQEQSMVSERVVERIVKYVQEAIP